MRYKIDLKGQRFGRQVVLGFGYRLGFKDRENGTYYRYYWQCRCDCGTIHYVEGTNLRLGRSQSCGCLRNERVSQTQRERYATRREAI